MLAAAQAFSPAPQQSGVFRRAAHVTLAPVQIIRAILTATPRVPRCLPAALLLFFAPLTVASEAQRELYSQTLPKVAASGIGSVPEAARALRSYPLYPYLLAEDLEWRLRQFAGPALDSEIEAFIHSRPDLPRTSLLRLRWLSSLYSRGEWRRVKALVEEDDSSTQQCRKLMARIRLGESGLAEDALDLWRVGASQPDACDPVFAWLEDQGLLTPKQILARARLAAVARRSSLVQYLAKKLPEAEANIARHWVALLGSPGDLHHVKSLDGDVAVTVFKRLALQDTDAAARLISELPTRLNLTRSQTHEMTRYIALLMAQNHDARALGWFDRLDRELSDDHVMKWHVRAALFQQNWPQVLRAINALPAELETEEEWRYWKARALEAMDRGDEARAMYKTLAEERSYHGYLAADRLGQPYAYNAAPLKPDAEYRRELLAQPAVQRAFEFLALDAQYDANREWNVATSKLDRYGLQQAALLAHDRLWHNRAIITLAQSDYWDDLNIRYPLPYREIAESYASERALDPAYVMAIMRTESLFMPTVRSPAGAIGLMQLMPGTARKVAADLNQPRPSHDDLKTPASNINFGTRYLQEQLARFSGNYALASAAYNAGPHRVSRWLPAVGMPADLWVENIPYDETREYVKRAMSHMTIFQLRLGREVSRVTQRIAPIGPTSERVTEL